MQEYTDISEIVKRKQDEAVKILNGLFEFGRPASQKREKQGGQISSESKASDILAERNIPHHRLTKDEV